MTSFSVLPWTSRSSEFLAACSAPCSREVNSTPGDAGSTAAPVDAAGSSGVAASVQGSSGPPDRTKRMVLEPDITEPVALLRHLFFGGDPPKCLDAADSDDSGRLNIADAIYSLNFLFLGGAEPLPPFTDCGIDPTLDDLDCKDPGDCG